MTISWRRGGYLKDDTSSATTALAYSSNNAGDLGWLGMAWSDPAGTIDISTVTDSAGNTWTAVGAKKRNTTRGQSVRMFYVATGLKSSGSNTVTVTLSSAAIFRRLHLFEYKSSNGPWSSNMLDKTGNGSGNGTAIATGSMTPASDNQLVAGFGFTYPYGNIGATAPYVERTTSSDGNSGGTERILSAGSGVGVTAQATSTTADEWAWVGATFADVGATVAPPVVAAPARPPRLTNVSSSGKARILLAGGR